ITTPGVEDERTAVVFEVDEHPVLFIVTLRSLHSSRSIIPLPLPPLIDEDTNDVLAGPLRQAFAVEVAPSLIVTICGVDGVQPCGTELTTTLYMPGASFIE